MNSTTLNQNQINAYQAEGAVLIKGLLSEWVETICAGIDRNMNEPGEYAAENVAGTETGRFFDDYCNWQRIPEFEDVIVNSKLAAAAAELMGSETVQVFHEHVLVKEPLWEKPVLPVRWLAEDQFYPDNDAYQPVPDPDEQGMLIREWNMQPGDVVAFHFKTLHGARGNNTNARRRAFSLRCVGDDARYVTRPGKTSPPFPGHEMQEGQRLREDWFPVVHPRTA